MYYVNQISDKQNFTAHMYTYILKGGGIANYGQWPLKPHPEDGRSRHTAEVYKIKRITGGGANYWDIVHGPCGCQLISLNCREEILILASLLEATYIYGSRQRGDFPGNLRRGAEICKD